MKLRLVIITGIIITLIMGVALTGCIEGSKDTQSPEETGSPTETITTESGLQYTIIKQGTGPQPRNGDIVEFNYTGTLEDGTVFDSSIGKSPVVFTLGVDRLLTGIAEGIGMMHGGGKAKLVIPPELAYGGTQTGNVPANSILHFELEILSVQQSDPPNKVAESDYKTTSSGLKYYDFAVGNGPSPDNGDSIVMHSAIWMADGTALGSTYDVGQPQIVPFIAGSLFPGLEEGLAGMHMGGKRQMMISPQLGYGTQGFTDPQSGIVIIPPDTTLIVETDLLGVIPVPEPSEFTEVNDEDYAITSTGLKYYDIETGNGPSPEDGQLVLVHYTGWLTDGEQFDSSIGRGQPLPFIIGVVPGQVIPGFEEGVGTMKVGSKRQLLIPSELGYNDGKDRIFEVHLAFVY